jgi:hypothetical protein
MALGRGVARVVPPYPPGALALKKVSAPRPSNPCYKLLMSPAIQPYDPELEAERLLLEAAVAKARADRRYAPHEEVRAWLLELANGNFSAPRPALREP